MTFTELLELDQGVRESKPQPDKNQRGRVENKGPKPAASPVKPAQPIAAGGKRKPTKKSKSPLSPLPSPTITGKTVAQQPISSELETRVGQPVDQSMDQSSQPVESTNSVNQSGQSTASTRLPGQFSQSVQSTNQLMGAVVKRPPAFYIPESINEKIEEALRYYQRKHHKKIDRSAIVSALLGDVRIWNKPALDKLAPKVIAQLKNRLNDRLTNQLTQSINQVD